MVDPGNSEDDMNWYNDFRKVTFITNEAKRENRSKGLGIFGWLGVIVWFIVGAAYCSHHNEAHSQSYTGFWMVDCTDMTQCLPLRKPSARSVHVYETQTACDVDMSQVVPTLPSGRRILCLPTSAGLNLAPSPVPFQSQQRRNETTTCATPGSGPTARLVCNTR